MKNRNLLIKMFLFICFVTCTAFQCDDRNIQCDSIVPIEVELTNFQVNPLNQAVTGKTSVNFLKLNLFFNTKFKDSINNTFFSGCNLQVMSDSFKAMRIYTLKTLGPLPAGTEMSSHFRLKNPSYNIDNNYYLRINEWLKLIATQAALNSIELDLVDPIKLASKQDAQFNIEIDVIRDNKLLTFTAQTYTFTVLP